MQRFGFLKVAALSPRVTVADPMANAEASLEAIGLAEAEGAQVMVLPELGLAGYTCGDLFQQRALLAGCEQALAAVLRGTRHSTAVLALGMPLRVQGRLFNVAVVAQGGRVLGAVPKQFLPNTREYYEKRWFAPYAGESFSITLAGQTIPFGRLLFQAQDCVLGIELCEDLWAPQPPSGTMALQGANVILNLSASNEEVAKQDYRRSLVAQQSGRLRCGYVYASAGPGESTTDLLFSGACLIAENGNVLTESHRFEPEGSAVYACLDLELLQAERQNSSFSDAALPVTLPVVACAPLPSLQPKHLGRHYSPEPFVPQSTLRRAEHCREILEIQTAALCKRLEHTGLQRTILGLSGGLDSTLALLVALRAATRLGWSAEQVLCVTMPGYGTTAHTRQTVDDLAAALAVTLWEIDIRPACDLHMQDIGHDPACHDTTYENLQARERTQILMDLANQEGALLLGTGDLSELALGWCTFNADHMSMYNLNGGVPKTLVRHLVAHCMQEEAGVAAAGDALRRVLETPISPELLPPNAAGQIAQKTEDSLGSYDMQDFYLYHFFRYGFTPQKLYVLAGLAFGDRFSAQQRKAWLQLFLRRFFAQQFKRSCLPDGPRVGSVSLSPRGDWRQPSDASARLWLEQAEQL